MRAIEGKFQITCNLGNYSSEQISLTMVCDQDESVTGLELLQAARNQVLQMTTAAKKKAALNGKIEHKQEQI